MRSLRAILVIAVWAATLPAQAGLLISADFGPQITNVHDFSGVEADAALADAAFSSANVWNPLRVADYAQTPTTNPTFSALKDSTGATTAVGFTITGSVNGFDFVSFYSANPADTLRHDMFFFNSRSATSSIDWAITGLVANAEYRFYAYGTRADAARLFDMLVDTDGDGLFTDETSKALGSTGTNMQLYQDAYFASVFADANGVIRGRGVGLSSREANWSGFQLAQVDANTVPEPSSFALVGLIALLGLSGSRRRKQ